MATALYADVHVAGPVILQFRLRGVNIAAATEEGHECKTDEELLSRASVSTNTLMTHMGR